METEKELSVVKTQATKALSVATELIVNSSDTYKTAEDIRAKIKTVGKMIDEKKKEITQPLNESLKRIRELFKPVETTHEQALDIIENKMLSFRQAETARIEAEKEKIAKKFEAGRIKEETAVNKFNNLGEVKNNLKEAGVKTTVRKLPKIRILNEAEIPREYMVVNEKLLLEALKAGKVVLGAELYYEEIIV